MSFDNRDIRPSMDVYTHDNVYLGTVLKIIPERGMPATADQPVDGSTQSSAVSGELMGPMPTMPIGNPGPHTQSARAGYTTQPDSARPLGQGTLRVGKWWGLLGRRTLPLDAVQTVSLERVVLRLLKTELERSS